MVENAIKLGELEYENSTLRDRIVELSGNIVTGNDEVLAVCERAKKLAGTNISVLILGENGTGKELLASLIHNNSPRASKKMVTVNSAAFPDSLLDNELFGHEKGAYTGARSGGLSAYSSVPWTPPSTWTRSATCPCPPRPRSCGRSRTRKSAASAARSPSRWTCA